MQLYTQYDTPYFSDLLAKENGSFILFQAKKKRRKKQNICKKYMFFGCHVSGERVKLTKKLFPFSVDVRSFVQWLSCFSVLQILFSFFFLFEPQNCTENSNQHIEVNVQRSVNTNAFEWFTVGVQNHK